MKKLTVCRELYTQGYITKEELVLETKYNRSNVPKPLIITYLIIIVPIVLLMRVSPLMTKVTNRVARRIWIDGAVKEMRKKESKWSIWK